MKLRRFVPCTIWCLLFGLLPRPLFAEPPSSRPPNVIFLLSDDQRPDTIAALGNDAIETPAFDALVRRGSVMTRAVCANPICTPSRAEILTGCSSFTNGVLDFGRRIDPELVTWPAAMSAAGYRTWYVGKWHNNGRPRDHGYDESLGLYAGGGGKWMDPEARDYRGHPVTGYRGWVFQTDEGEKFPERGVGLTPDISARFADAAIALIRREHDRPYFLHVNFTAPHDPLLWPPGFEARYRAADVPLPENYQPRHPFDHGNFEGRDEKMLPWPRTRELVRADLACYYAVISHLDRQIGRIIKAVNEAGHEENTIVIFSSDHGLAMGSHGLRGKQNMYEHTIGAPLILAGRGVPRGKRFAAQVYLRDLYPTVCDLAGVKTPATVEAKSFAPVLRGETEQIHPHVFGYFRNFQRMIRTQRWKLIHYPAIGRTQLFDLAADPFELRDLSEEARFAETKERLAAQLTAWQKEVGDPLVAEKSSAAGR